MIRSVLLLSGGLDSVVLMVSEVLRNNHPLCLTIDYGQTNSKEICVAASMAGRYGCPWKRVEIPPSLVGGSALTGDKPMPLEALDLDRSKPNAAPTSVPGRNMLFLSIAVAEAIRVGATEVLYAVHKPSETVYQSHDNSPDFVHGMSVAMKAGYGVSLAVPFLRMTKNKVVEHGLRFGVKPEETWSCFQNGEVPCGQCGACRSRAECGV